MSVSARDVVSIVIKLLVASLIVGLVFHFLDIRPQRLFHDLPDLVRDAFDTVVGLVRWAIPYILLGAVVVVPVWAIVMLLRLARRRG